MKAIFPFAALLIGVSSLALAPSLNDLKIADSPVHDRKVGNVPTVDDTSSRSQWVNKDKSKGDEETGKGPTVDTTATRSQWVSKYKSKGDEGTGKGPTVDTTATRSQWVSKYKSAPELAVSDHWLPTGPAYLDANALETGYHAHLMLMLDSSNWLQSNIRYIKRFLGDHSV